MIHSTLSDKVVNHTKTATLRAVTEKLGWWSQLQDAVEKYGIVRAQTGRSHTTIFGWLKIVSISEAGLVITFLNPVSKTELGCEGWEDDEYINRWCGGEHNTTVRRIDFLFIPYYRISDFHVTMPSVKTFVESISISDVRSRAKHNVGFKAYTPGPNVSHQLELTRSDNPSKHLPVIGKDRHVSVPASDYEAIYRDVAQRLEAEQVRSRLHQDQDREDLRQLRQREQKLADEALSLQRDIRLREQKCSDEALSFQRGQQTIASQQDFMLRFMMTSGANAAAFTTPHVLAFFTGNQQF